MNDNKETEDALFSLVQELKIANNDIDERLRQQKLRTEEAKIKLFEDFERAIHVGGIGLTLLATTVAALTVYNGM